MVSAFDYGELHDLIANFCILLIAKLLSRRKKKQYDLINVKSWLVNILIFLRRKLCVNGLEVIIDITGNMNENIYQKTMFDAHIPIFPLL